MVKQMGIFACLVAVLLIEEQKNSEVKIMRHTLFILLLVSFSSPNNIWAFIEKNKSDSQATGQVQTNENDDETNLRKVLSISKDMSKLLKEKDYSKFVKSYVYLKEGVTDEEIAKLAAGFKDEKVLKLIEALDGLSAYTYEFTERTSLKSIKFDTSKTTKRKIQFVLIKGEWKCTL